MPTKPVYKKQDIKKLNPSLAEAWTAKIDGAHTIINMNPGEVPKHFSHRISKRTGEPIDYTPKLLHVQKPICDCNAIVRGETFATDKKGKAVHPDVVTALLNSKTQKSLDLQKKLDIKTRTALIDVDEYDGEDLRRAPFSVKRKILEDIVKKNPNYILPDIAYSEKEKESLLNKILSKSHPQTKEGLVVHDLHLTNKPFIKAKIIDDYDVYIKDIFKEEGVKAGRKSMAGGFTYSWTPDGKAVGKVGTGFNHKEKEDMLKNPDKYKGLVAKVKALDLSKNKVLVKPSFAGWHVDKNIEDKEAMYKEEIIKMAEEKETSTSTRLVAGAGGIGLLSASKKRLLGQQRVYHGTTLKNWDGIKSGGLRASKGSTGGASDALARASNNSGASKIFKDTSKGNVHFTKRKSIARQFANIANEKSKYIIDNLFVKMQKGGKLVKINLPYDQWNKALPDEHMAKPINRIGEFLVKHMLGAKTNHDIPIEAIKGSDAKLIDKMKYVGKNLPGYIKKYPGRFGSGVALASGGTMLLNKAIKKDKNIEDIEDKEAMEEYGMNKIARYKEEIVKMAESKAKSYLHDFAAGIDPTGVMTFKKALKDKEDHNRHRRIGNIGGVISGATAGVLLPAALTGATALALKKKNPSLSKEFSIMTRGALDAFNPKALYRYTKSLGPFSKYKDKGQEVLRETDDLVQTTKNLRSKITNKFKNAEKINTEDLKDLEGIAHKTNKISTGMDNLKSQGKKIKDKFYKGKPVDEGGLRAFTALTTAGSMLGGGVLSGLSSDTQYKTGLKTQKMIEDTINNRLKRE